MRFDKFTTADWLKAGGGALMLIAGFLPWWKIEFQGLASGSNNAFDYFFTGTIPWLLLVGIAVITALTRSGSVKMPPTLPLPLVVLGAAALSFLLVLIRFINDGIDDDAAAAAGVDISRGIGLFLAAIAVVVVLVGTALGFRESGGEFSDLKDLNKLKGSFGAGGSGAAGGGSAPGASPPPPPPPPSSPPPPPPAGP